MTTPDCSPYWDEILSHFLEGKPLSSGAREHYLQCVECIAAVTAELNKVATDKIQTRGPAVKTTVLPEAARQALEHGRQVLKREFGIGAGSKPGASM